MTIDASKILPTSMQSDISLSSHEVLFDKIRNELSKFGLTPNQSKVFLYLEKYGSSTATQVSKALKIPRTETYHLLTNLQNKGIISAAFQHPIRFTSLPMDKAITTLINAEKERVKNLETQEKKLIDMWNALPRFKTNNEEVKDGKFQMLQGTNQMTGKIKEMLSGSKETIQVLASEKDFMKFYHAGYLEIIENSKSEVQIISSSSEKTSYIFEGNLMSKVKKTPMKIKEDLCFIIIDEKESILFMKNTNEVSQNVLAMWTDSSSMVYTLKLLFTYVWSNSKHFKNE
ncbi:TrmB family transcriptional regulator [Nitrosotalea sinensis]|nr:helix-turn-helix domain-containing protein [Candidatus Nitrosotalea sinensis]